MLSKKDVNVYLSTNFNIGEIDADVTRNALISIAQELQRFHEETKQNNNDDCEVFEKLNTYTTKIKRKNKQLKKYKGNLKIACMVTKVIMSAKDRETEVLTNHLNIIRNESLNLIKSHRENVTLIEKLQAENFNINNDVQRVNNFIHLGYQEVQKMRNEMPKDVPIILELKEILIACGQYYADYCNEHQRCSQLEQRNRFLKNKLSILENNLAATAEELRNLKNQNIRLTRSLDSKHVELLPKIQTISVPKQLQCEIFGLTPKLSGNDNVLQATVSNSESIACRLSAVRNLICDQDSMLEDLKKLSEELSAPVLI